jgi:hypothetical protein
MPPTESHWRRLSGPGQLRAGNISRLRLLGCLDRGGLPSSCPGLYPRRLMVVTLIGGWVVIDWRPMKDWLAEQSRRNRESLGAWQSFAGHRRRVTDLLSAAAEGRVGPSLCLLGAGNCNDVELPALLGRYERIHLVDWDALALRAGVERQTLADHPGIICHGEVDLGSSDPMGDMAPVHVAASLCLLSQLLEAANAGGSSPERLLAARRLHLELLVELIQPGGTGLLITDVVSSETVPPLGSTPEEALPALLAQCIASRNFFSGTNPAPILDLLRGESWFAARIESVEPIGPWKWDFGPRWYIAYAIRFSRRR